MLKSVTTTELKTIDINRQTARHGAFTVSEYGNIKYLVLDCGIESNRLLKALQREIETPAYKTIYDILKTALEQSENAKTSNKVTSCDVTQLRRHGIGNLMKSKAVITVLEQSIAKYMILDITRTDKAIKELAMQYGYIETIGIDRINLLSAYKTMNILQRLEQTIEN